MVDDLKLTIALQNEMMVETSPIGKGGNIVIHIPDVCARDLWDAQIEFWLEDDKNGNKLTDDGFLRILKKKLKLERRKKF